MAGWIADPRKNHSGTGASHTVCRRNRPDTGSAGGGDTHHHSDSAGARCHTLELWGAEKKRGEHASLPSPRLNTFQEKKCIHQDDHQVAVCVIVYDGCWREAQWCLLRTPQGMLVPL